jgi:hypothetical protein
MLDRSIPTREKDGNTWFQISFLKANTNPHIKNKK